MSHKKDAEVHQHKFNLSDDVSDEKRLHDYLVKLAEDGKKTRWIVERLVENLPAAPKPAGQVNVGKVVSPKLVKEVTYGDPDE